MDSKKIIKHTFLLLTVVLIMSNCAQDDVNPPQQIAPQTNIIPIGQGRVQRGSPAICDFQLDETTLTSSGWIKVFEDNFTTDLSKWNIWTGGAFNNELQYYQASNLQVLNGNLVITTKKETVTGATTPYDQTPKTFNYTSGRIECKSIVSANANTPKVRMMARIKLPSGYGMWPAFWSYGNNWPTQGEIDILEARGQEPTKYQTNYFYGTTANNNLVRNAAGYITANQDLTTCYHVYEMIWEQSKLTSYLDGAVVEVKTAGSYIPDLFGKQENIVLNVAVGGAFFFKIRSITNSARYDVCRLGKSLYLELAVRLNSKFNNQESHL